MYTEMYAKYNSTIYKSVDIGDHIHVTSLWSIDKCYSQH